MWCDHAAAVKSWVQKEKKNLGELLVHVSVLTVISLTGQAWTQVVTLKYVLMVPQVRAPYAGAKILYGNES